MKKRLFTSITALITTGLLCITQTGLAMPYHQTDMNQTQSLQRIVQPPQNDLLLKGLLDGNKKSAQVLQTQEGTAASLAQEKADALVNLYGTTSVQYALMDDKSITLSGHAGVYSKTENRALTSDTLYGIGSVSKMYITTAIMQLVDQGKIDLDHPVVNYIPEFTMADARYTQITPRMLLNHSSGLYGSTFQNALLWDDNDSYAHDHLLEALKTQRLKADPGAFSVYCNDGFTLLEILLERVTGESFTAYLEHHIFKPLGITNTFTPVSSFDRTNLAKTYPAGQQGEPQENPVDTLNVIATGGIYSSAEDLLKLSNAYTDPTSGILSEASIQATQADEFARGIWPDPATDDNWQYGLGWDSVNLFPFSEYGIKALTKGGDTQFYHASIVVLPELGLSAAVLSSGGSSATNQIVAVDMLLNTLREKGVIDEIKAPKSFEVTQEQPVLQNLKQYEGIYGSNIQIFKIEFSDTKLLLKSPLDDGSPAQEYIHTGDGFFVDAAGTTKLSIVPEENGQVYLWLQGYANYPLLGQTASSVYMVQKLESNEIPEAVQAAWEARSANKYYVVNEKYSSQKYSLAFGFGAFGMIPTLPGYVSTSKIVDENHAVSNIQIPGMSGRDSSDLYYYSKDGKNFLEVSGMVMLEGTSVPNIWGGDASICTILDDGFTRWFTIAPEDAGKVMTVDVPENTTVAVYDQTGSCVYNAYAQGNQSVSLPQGGSIAFAGNAGARFEITLKALQTPAA